MVFEQPFWFIAILGILVLAHEIGHFVTAKRAGVKVIEFGIGFPPRLVAFRRGETEYSLNLIPLGGFVKMLGEEDPSAPRSLASKSIGTRLVVLGAGAFMNAVLAVVLFALAFMLPKDIVTGPVVIEEVVKSSPAAQAGLQAGDRILAINGRPVRNLLDVSQFITLSLGDDVEMTVRRAQGGQETLRMSPRWAPPPGEGWTGIRIGYAQDRFGRPQAYRTSEAYPLWEAVPLAFRQTYEVLILTKNEIYSKFLQGAPPPVAGPVGIYQITGIVVQQQLAVGLSFAASLSISLALINILPFPMLDGGRMLFVALEAVRGGRRIPPEKESLVHFVGLVVLLSLMVLITYNDILRILNNQSVIR
ncbi:MAG: site-2 protease family protein [Chloroflexi bacterium]|nr:site-2 protease family protein [Chloroflexota bacterium]